MRITIDIPNEYIDHFKMDRFCDALQRLKADAHCLAGNYETETAEMLINALQNAENEAPTADVREVKRGHWVKLPGFVTPGGDPVWGCSECGKGVHVYGIEANTYAADVADHQWIACPNCGAIMDGDGE